MCGMVTSISELCDDDDAVRMIYSSACAMQSRCSGAWRWAGLFVWETYVLYDYAENATEKNIYGFRARNTWLGIDCVALLTRFNRRFNIEYISKS